MHIEKRDNGTLIVNGDDLELEAVYDGSGHIISAFVLYNTDKNLYGTSLRRFSSTADRADALELVLDFARQWADLVDEKEGAGS